MQKVYELPVSSTGRATLPIIERNFRLLLVRFDLVSIGAALTYPILTMRQFGVVSPILVYLPPLDGAIYDAGLYQLGKNLPYANYLVQGTQAQIICGLPDIQFNDSSEIRIDVNNSAQGTLSDVSVIVDLEDE